MFDRGLSTPVKSCENEKTLLLFMAENIITALKVLWKKYFSPLIQ